MLLLSDGALLSADSTIKAWNTSDGSFRRTMSSHTQPINALLAVNNSVLASASSDGTVKLWSMSDKVELMRTLTAHSGSVNCLALLSNGADFASGGADSLVHIWDLRNLSVRISLRRHTLAITALLSLSSKGLLASASLDNDIMFWNVTDGSFKQRLVGNTLGMSALLLLPSGEMASGGHRSDIQIWNIELYQLVKTLSTNNKRVMCLSLAPQASFASASDDDTITIWSSSYAINKTISGAGKYFVGLPSGHFAIADNSGRIRIIDPRTPLNNLIQTLGGHASQVNALITLPDAHLASASADKIFIWSVHSGDLKRVIANQGGTVHCLLLLHSGELASGESFDNRMKIWDWKTGTFKRHLIGHLKPVRSIIELKSGDIVSASDDFTIRVWNPYEIEIKATIFVPTGIKEVRTMVALRNFNNEEYIATASIGQADIIVWSFS
jgi:WD40 repeat protein